MRYQLFADDPPSADEEVARLRLQLRDSSLAELENAGIVRWDRENNIVRKGPEFEFSAEAIRWVLPLF